MGALQTGSLNIFVQMILMAVVFVIVFFVMSKIMKKNYNEKSETDQEFMMKMENSLSNLDLLIRENRQYIDNELKRAKQELSYEIKSSRQETLDTVQKTTRIMGEIINDNQKASAENQDRRLKQLNEQFKDMAVQNEQKLENIRKSMEQKITTLQEENNKQLDKMRETVDEKLQKTLEDRISRSFKLVSDRLEQVYKGLGEMQNLASGVGDLKKVLSNVKTRGILGEIQLGAILDQVLSKEQYIENAKIKKNSTERVEFAIKLPGDEDKEVLLPIDAKFHGDTYSNLVDAYERGDKAEIDEARKNLEKAIKKSAKDISDKYIEPPISTDFAIMFLPFEGLYAEVVNRGLVEVLQREYKVNIAGPTTMAALLNSLQMGFKTLAIQKHSSQVWDILGAVKTEFNKFGDVLQKTQMKITQANAELDKLIGVRTRVIQRKLNNVDVASDIEAKNILEIEDLSVVVEDE